MIPLHDLERPGGPTPVTRLLLLLNVAVWIYVLTLLDRPDALRLFYDRWSFDWSEFLPAIRAGDAPLATIAPLITHQFLHGGWLHLIGNLLYLWIFGDNVEDRVGSVPFLVMYLLAGAVAAIAQGIVAPGPMVGASGAIAAVLGASIVIAPAARIRTLVFLGIFITVVNLPALIVIGLWIVVQVLASASLLRLDAHEATARVAYVAHVAGFVTGMLLVGVFARRGR